MISFGVMRAPSSFQFSSLALYNFNFVRKPWRMRAKSNRPTNDWGMIVDHRLQSGVELIND